MVTTDAQRTPCAALMAIGLVGRRCMTLFLLYMELSAILRKETDDVKLQRESQDSRCEGLVGPPSPCSQKAVWERGNE